MSRDIQPTYGRIESFIIMAEAYRTRMLTSRFTILDRYVSRELLLTTLAVTLVLMLILLSGTLARLLGKAAEGAIPSDAVWPMLMFTGARYLILLIPLSLYLGVLLSFSRLYKDNEMAAMGACGIGLGRLYRPLFMVSLPVIALLAYLTLSVMPWISQQAENLKADIENRSELSGLIAGRFNESRKGDAIMFLQQQSDDGKSMKNVFLHQSIEQQPGQVALDHIESASRASRYRDSQGRHFILFEAGQHYEGQPGQSDFRITEYQRKGVYLPEEEQNQKLSPKKALDSLTLWQSERADYHAELHWRLSLPVAALLLAMLALPLSYTTPRKGRFSKLGLAILIYLIYSNLLGVGQTWMESGQVPRWLGIWWVHGIVLLLVIYWWMRRGGGFIQYLRRWQQKQVSV